MEEIWKDISGYEGLYQVSNFGNVKSLNWRRTGKPKNLYLKAHNRGYLQVELAKNGVKKSFMVHRLVAEAFIKNPNGFPVINHKDEDKANNSVENLEWCDNRYNKTYSSGKPVEQLQEIVKNAVAFGIDSLTMIIGVFLAPRIKEVYLIK